MFRRYRAQNPKAVVRLSVYILAGMQNRAGEAVRVGGGAAHTKSGRFAYFRFKVILGTSSRCDTP